MAAAVQIGNRRFACRTSSEDVATSPFSRPDLSSSSMPSRRSRDSEPWWALTSSNPGAGGRPSCFASALGLLSQRSTLLSPRCISRHGTIEVLVPDRAGSGGLAIPSPRRAGGHARAKLSVTPSRRSRVRTLRDGRGRSGSPSVRTGVAAPDILPSITGY